MQARRSRANFVSRPTNLPKNSSEQSLSSRDVTDDGSAAQATSAQASTATTVNSFPSTRAANIGEFSRLSRPRATNSATRRLVHPARARQRVAHANHSKNALGLAMSPRLISPNGTTAFADTISNSRARARALPTSFSNRAPNQVGTRPLPLQRFALSRSATPTSRVKGKNEPISLRSRSDYSYFSLALAFPVSAMTRAETPRKTSTCASESLTRLTSIIRPTVATNSTAQKRALQAKRVMSTRQIRAHQFTSGRRENFAAPRAAFATLPQRIHPIGLVAQRTTSHHNDAFRGFTSRFAASVHLPNANFAALTPLVQRVRQPEAVWPQHLPRINLLERSSGALEKASAQVAQRVSKPKTPTRAFRPLRIPAPIRTRQMRRAASSQTLPSTFRTASAAHKFEDQTARQFFPSQRVEFRQSEIRAHDSSQPKRASLSRLFMPRTPLIGSIAAVRARTLAPQTRPAAPQIQAKFATFAPFALAKAAKSSSDLPTSFARITQNANLQPNPKTLTASRATKPSVTPIIQARKVQSSPTMPAQQKLIGSLAVSPFFGKVPLQRAAGFLSSSARSIAVARTARAWPIMSAVTGATIFAAPTAKASPIQTHMARLPITNATTQNVRQLKPAGTSQLAELTGELTRSFLPRAKSFALPQTHLQVLADAPKPHLLSYAAHSVTQTLLPSQTTTFASKAVSSQLLQAKYQSLASRQTTPFTRSVESATPQTESKSLRFVAQRSTLHAPLASVVTVRKSAAFSPSFSIAFLQLRRSNESAKSLVLPLQKSVATQPQNTRAKRIEPPARMASKQPDFEARPARKFSGIISTRSTDMLGARGGAALLPIQSRNIAAQVQNLPNRTLRAVTSPSVQFVAQLSTPRTLFTIAETVRKTPVFSSTAVAPLQLRQSSRHGKSLSSPFQTARTLPILSTFFSLEEGALAQPQKIRATRNLVSRPAREFSGTSPTPSTKMLLAPTSAAVRPMPSRRDATQARSLPAKTLRSANSHLVQFVAQLSTPRRLRAPLMQSALRPIQARDVAKNAFVSQQKTFVSQAAFPMHSAQLTNAFSLAVPLKARGVSTQQRSKSGNAATRPVQARFADKSPLNLLANSAVAANATSDFSWSLSKSKPTSRSTSSAKLVKFTPFFVPKQKLFVPHVAHSANAPSISPRLEAQKFSVPERSKTIQFKSEIATQRVARLYQNQNGLQSAAPQFGDLHVSNSRSITSTVLQARFATSHRFVAPKARALPNTLQAPLLSRFAESRFADKAVNERLSVPSQNLISSSLSIAAPLSAPTRQWKGDTKPSALLRARPIELLSPQILSKSVMSPAALVAHDYAPAQMRIDSPRSMALPMQMDFGATQAFIPQQRFSLPGIKSLRNATSAMGKSPVLMRSNSIVNPSKMLSTKVASVQARLATTPERGQQSKTSYSVISHSARFATKLSAPHAPLASVVTIHKAQLFGIAPLQSRRSNESAKSLVLPLQKSVATQPQDTRAKRIEPPARMASKQPDFEARPARKFSGTSSTFSASLLKSHDKAAVLPIQSRNIAAQVQNLPNRTLHSADSHLVQFVAQLSTPRRLRAPLMQSALRPIQARGVAKNAFVSQQKSFVSQAVFPMHSAQLTNAFSLAVPLKARGVSTQQRSKSGNAATRPVQARFVDKSPLNLLANSAVAANATSDFSWSLSKSKPTSSAKLVKFTPFFVPKQKLFVPNSGRRTSALSYSLFVTQLFSAKQSETGGAAVRAMQAKAVTKQTQSLPNKVSRAANSHSIIAPALQARFAASHRLVAPKTRALQNALQVPMLSRLSVPRRNLVSPPRPIALLSLQVLSKSVMSPAALVARADTPSRADWPVQMKSVHDVRAEASTPHSHLTVKRALTSALTLPAAITEKTQTPARTLWPMDASAQENFALSTSPNAASLAAPNVAMARPPAAALQRAIVPLQRAKASETPKQNALQAFAPLQRKSQKSESVAAPIQASFSEESVSDERMDEAIQVQHLASQVWSIIKGRLRVEQIRSGRT